MNSSPIFHNRLVALGWAAGLTLAPLHMAMGQQPQAAQQTPATPSGGAAPTTTAPAHPTLSAEQLDNLLAPVALYPDPLLAQILPASTVPADIVKAQRYLNSKQDPAKIDEQPWEQSVKALARYPDVLKMMDDKLDWTTELGTAFVYQPTDVFASIQRLREKAASVGNLKDTPQQTIVKETVSEKEIIKIEPTDPEVVYVPQYSPEVVYVEQPTDVVTPLVTFGAGLVMGAWLHNEIFWDDDCVYSHNDGYHGGNYGSGNTVNIGNGSGNGGVWKPGSPGGIGGPGGPGGPGGIGGPGGVGGIGGPGGLGGLGAASGIGGVGGVGKPGGIGKPGGVGGVGKPGKPGGIGSTPRPKTRPSASSRPNLPAQASNFAREGTKPRPADLGYRQPTPRNNSMRSPQARSGGGLGSFRGNSGGFRGNGGGMRGGGRAGGGGGARGGGGRGGGGGGRRGR